MSSGELQTFLDTWNTEAEKAAKLLEALPAGQYHFRPTPDYRSIGEMAWHLAELDAYMSVGIAQGGVDFSAKIPGLERPADLAGLAPGYRRVHAESVARLAHLAPADLDRLVPFMAGRELPVRALLWDAILHHLIHHRAQLSLMCRLASGRPPGMYGPNREGERVTIGRVGPAR